MNALVEEALEHLFLEDDAPSRCQSSDEMHQCTLIARWICHGHFHRAWCDGRYAKWTRERSLFLCPECKMPNHWIVVPL